MKQELLATLCLLQVTPAWLANPDSIEQKFSGKWFSIAVASEFTALTDYYRRLIIMEPMANGDIVLHVENPADDCKMEKVHLTLDQVSGGYLVGSQRQNKLAVVEADFASYAIVLVKMEQGKVLHLYARKPQADDDIKQKYEKLVKYAGMSAEKIIYLKKPDLCSKE